MVPSGIVDNDDHESTVTLMTEKLLKKEKKRSSIKFLIKESDKTSTGVANSPKKTNTFTHGCMKHHGVGVFRGQPHGAA